MLLATCFYELAQHHKTLTSLINDHIQGYYDQFYCQDKSLLAFYLIESEIVPIKKDNTMILANKHELMKQIQVYNPQTLIDATYKYHRYKTTMKKFLTGVSIVGKTPEHLIFHIDLTKTTNLIQLRYQLNKDPHSVADSLLDGTTDFSGNSNLDILRDLLPKDFIIIPDNDFSCHLPNTYILLDLLDEYYFKNSGLHITGAFIYVPQYL